MKNAVLLLTTCLILALVSSCSIEKRRVNKGYFVQWNWNKKSKLPVATGEIREEETSQTQSRDEHENPGQIIFSADENPDEKIRQVGIPAVVEKNGGNSLKRKAAAEAQNPAPAEEWLVFKREVKASPKAARPMDVELAINIVLLVVFLALAILFTIFALNAAAGTMLYVWIALAFLCFVIFVTQVIDVILW